MKSSWCVPGKPWIYLPESSGRHITGTICLIDNIAFPDSTRQWTRDGCSRATALNNIIGNRYKSSAQSILTATLKKITPVVYQCVESNQHPVGPVVWSELGTICHFAIAISYKDCRITIFKIVTVYGVVISKNSESGRMNKIIAIDKRFVAMLCNVSSPAEYIFCLPLICKPMPMPLQFY